MPEPDDAVGVEPGSVPVGTPVPLQMVHGGDGSLQSRDALPGETQDRCDSAHDQFSPTLEVTRFLWISPYRLAVGQNVRDLMGGRSVAVNWRRSSARRSSPHCCEDSPRITSREHVP